MCEEVLASYTDRKQNQKFYLVSHPSKLGSVDIAVAKKETEASPKKQGATLQKLSAESDTDLNVKVVCSGRPVASCFCQVQTLYD